MIDINSDMGESFGAYQMGDDEALLGYVTSASIACGFHAGDPRTIDATVARAAARQVSIGAHVSYPDLVGFGRRSMRVSAGELVADVLYQIGALEAFCRRHGTSVRYVKAHGALYNDLADNEELAAAFGDALLAYGGDLAALVLAGSTSVGVLAQQGVRVVREGFADRGYTAGGRAGVPPSAGRARDRAGRRRRARLADRLRERDRSSRRVPHRGRGGLAVRAR